MIEQDIHDMTLTMMNLKVLIAMFYVLISLAIFWAGRKAEDSAQRMAVFSLTGIFVLCDVSGYAGPALGLPHWMILSTHFLLPAFCIVFLFTNQHSRLFSK